MIATETVSTPYSLLGSQTSESKIQLFLLFLYFETFCTVLMEVERFPELFADTKIRYILPYVN